MEVRVIGYKNRRPYLYIADLAARTIEPVAELRAIPQAIDCLVPLGSVVAVGCGPNWFGIAADLSGELGRLQPAEERSAEIARANVAFLGGERETPELDFGCGVAGEIRHPDVHYWFPFATLSPNRRTIALAGSTRPRPPRRSLSHALDAEHHAERASVLGLVDVDTMNVQLCSGHFDEACDPPVWSSTGETVVFHAPMDDHRLYAVDRTERELRPIDFRARSVSPLLDADLLPMV